MKVFVYWLRRAGLGPMGQEGAAHRLIFFTLGSTVIVNIPLLLSLVYCHPREFWERMIKQWECPVFGSVGVDDWHENG